MTVYLSFRSAPVGGGVINPVVLQGDGAAAAPTLAAVPLPSVGMLVAGKNIVFAIHGFNVSYEDGARSLARFEQALRLGPADLFIGVLWPGDAWIPVVNYPFEGSDAMQCGGLLAEFCHRWLASAPTLSFFSHSLGARVVLEAVRRLKRRARVICLTAAALNRDCLATQYSAARDNASAIAILSSRSDWVLKLAYPVGDFIADLLHYDHEFFRSALGYNGPALPVTAPIGAPWQIPDGADYGHGDYLPPGDSVWDSVAAEGAKWTRVAKYMRGSFHAEAQNWHWP